MAVMVKKHQMALFVLYLTSFVAIVNTRSTYFDTFCPSYGTKASKFLLYLTSTVLSVHMCLNKVHILIHLTPV